MQEQGCERFARTIKMCRLLILGLSLVFAQGLNADSSPQSRERIYEDAWLKIRLISRTPQQVAAFYEGRGFPSHMVELIASKCFITVGIRNKGADVLWHELDRWRFTGARGRIERIDRAWWKARWRAVNAPMPSQSTFRWTLLPERLDFSSGEAEGGNLVLPRVGGPFTLEADFVASVDQASEKISVRLENLYCAEDSEH